MNFSSIQSVFSTIPKMSPLSPSKKMFCLLILKENIKCCHLKVATLLTLLNDTLLKFEHNTKNSDNSNF